MFQSFGGLPEDYRAKVEIAIGNGKAKLLINYLRGGSNDTYKSFVNALIAVGEKQDFIDALDPQVGNWKMVNCRHLP